MSDKKLLGALRFVSRTFEGGFKENPYVLDMDANLYVGPADHIARDEHGAVEVIFHFLNETGKQTLSMRELFRNRLSLLEAFAIFDEARSDDGAEEFRILIFGTYDGEPLMSPIDDGLPAGPCGRTVNEIKQRMYAICAREDKAFNTRHLTPELQRVESRFQ